MQRLYTIIVPLLLIFTVQKVSAQVLPKTVSIGATLQYQDNRYENHKSLFTYINLNPDVQYFYKANRAVVGGYTFNRSTHENLSYSHDGAVNTWHHMRYNRGAFIGLRQHHPINEKFHIFTEFGFRYAQEKWESKHVSVSPSSGNQYRYSGEDYSVSGYGKLGIMYFINRRFSLETTLVNGSITYRRPVDSNATNNYWIYELNGTNQLSFALRYFFQVGGKEK